MIKNRSSLLICTILQYTYNAQQEKKRNNDKLCIFLIIYITDSFK